VASLDEWYSVKFSSPDLREHVFSLLVCVGWLAVPHSVWIYEAAFQQTNMLGKAGLLEVSAPLVTDTYGVHEAPTHRT
jgi:hypothetical protein